ncbi:MAG: PIG-L family deacetylase [Chloroflexi bacterium]|nr:PIG-L family deacetylase [Chloroflexota bacterium]
MYFFELSERYTTRAGYFVLHGVVNIAFGLAALVKPAWTANFLIQVFGLWLVINGVLQILTVVLGGKTRNLWHQSLASGITSLLAGGLALESKALAIDITGVILGLLLVFRAFLELTMLVEAQMRTPRQRVLLLGVVLSLLSGCVLLVSPFNDDYAFEKLLGIYVIVLGIVHVNAAWRLSDQIQASEAQSHTLMAQSRFVPVIAEGTEPVPTAGPELVSSIKQKRPRRWVPGMAGTKLDLGKYRRPIVLVPHPDDLEAFAGGLVYQIKVGVLSVIFAGGDKGVWSSDFETMRKTDYIRVRLEEAADAAQLLGVSEIIYMGYLDREVECTEEAVQKVVDIFREYQPDLVVSFEFYGRANPYPHPDHRAVGEIVQRAVARYEHRDRLDYLVTSTIIPNIFLDVTGVRRVKLEALACHATQTGLNGIIFPFLEKLITRLWGAFAGVDYAEGYRLVDIPQLVERLGSHDVSP